MKQPTIALSIFLLAFLFIFSCEEVRETKDYSDKVLNEHIIPIEQGLKMYDEFYSSRTRFIEPRLKRIFKDSTFEDTKFVSFSLEEIKSYIAFIDNIQKENPDYDVSGLRVYFAAYPNSKEFNGKRIKNPGQQTFFMVPTVSIDNKDKTYPQLNSLPFYIQGTTENPLKGAFIIVDELMLDYNKPERLKLYKKNEARQKASFNILTSLAPNSIIATSTFFNEGEMSPPPKSKN